MGQNTLLHACERRSRLDAEIVRQPRPGLGVRVQRVGLPAGAIQRQHELLPEGLAVGLLEREGPQLHGQLPLEAECQLRVDAGPRARPVATARGAWPRCWRTTRRRTPRARGRATRRAPLGGAGRPWQRRRRRALLRPSAARASKRNASSMLRFDPKAVARGVVGETRAFIAEHGTQSGDVDVQPVPGDVRDLAGPELLDQSLCPDGLVSADQQAGEQAALAQRTEVTRQPILQYLELAQDPESRGHPRSVPLALRPYRERSLSAR